MQPNPLLPLLGSLLYFASVTLCQLQMGKQLASPFTTEATTETAIIIHATFYIRPSAAATTKESSVSPMSISGEPISVTSALTPSATAMPRRSKDQLKKLILDALLEVPDIELFAALVRSQPDLFDLLNPESDYTILVPNNAAVEGADTGGALGGNGSYSPGLALSFVERGFANLPLTAGPRTLKTALKDWMYVNLGQGEGARIVVNKDLSITAGMGRSVIFGDPGYQFDAGTIYVGKDVLTLPEELPSTLRSTNGTKFLKSLTSDLQFPDLLAARHVTLFALTDAAATSAGDSLVMAALDQHIIRGLPGYTPDLVPGQEYRSVAGGKLRVTIRGDDYFVNGVKIVKPNVIMTNGVVHFVEKIIGDYPDIKGAAGGSPISPSITLLAIVAALTVYCLMA